MASLRGPSRHSGEIVLSVRGMDCTVYFIYTFLGYYGFDVFGGLGPSIRHQLIVSTEAKQPTPVSANLYLFQQCIDSLKTIILQEDKFCRDTSHSNLQQHKHDIFHYSWPQYAGLYSFNFYSWLTFLNLLRLIAYWPKKYWTLSCLAARKCFVSVVNVLDLAEERRLVRTEHVYNLFLARGPLGGATVWCISPHSWSRRSLWRHFLTAGAIHRDWRAD